MPGMVKPHRGGKEGLQRHRPGGGFLEGQALRFLVRGVCIEEMMSMDPSATAADHGQPVLFGPQGGRELEEGAVVAHVEFVQRQVVDRGPRRDIQPRRLGAVPARAAPWRW